jgi:hypothetical protein
MAAPRPSGCLRCSGCSCPKRGWSRSEPIDPTHDFGEQRSRHRHFGQLEDDVAAVADDLSTDLDQLAAPRRRIDNLAGVAALR